MLCETSVADHVWTGSFNSIMKRAKRRPAPSTEGAGRLFILPVDNLYLHLYKKWNKMVE